MHSHLTIFFDISAYYIRTHILTIILSLLQKTLVNKIIDTLEYINAVKFIVLNLSKVHIINYNLQYITLILAICTLCFYEII